MQLHKKTIKFKNNAKLAAKHTKKEEKINKKKYRKKGQIIIKVEIDIETKSNVAEAETES